MPNASLKSRGTDTVRVCSEAGPKESPGSQWGELQCQQILNPPFVPSHTEGSAEGLPVFCRGDCNDMGWLSFSWDHLRPPAIAPSALPIFSFILAPLAPFRLPLKQAVRIQHRAVENDLVYCGKSHLKFPCFLPVLLPNHSLLSIAEDVDWRGCRRLWQDPIEQIVFL